MLRRQPANAGEVEPTHLMKKEAARLLANLAFQAEHKGTIVDSGGLVALVDAARLALSSFPDPAELSTLPTLPPVASPTAACAAMLLEVTAAIGNLASGEQARRVAATNVQGGGGGVARLLVRLLALPLASPAAAGRSAAAMASSVAIAATIACEAARALSNLALSNATHPNILVAGAPHVNMALLRMCCLPGGRGERSWQEPWRFARFGVCADCQADDAAAADEADDAAAAAAADEESKASADDCLSRLDPRGTEGLALTGRLLTLSTNLLQRRNVVTGGANEPLGDILRRHKASTETMMDAMPGLGPLLLCVARGAPAAAEPLPSSSAESGASQAAALLDVRCKALHSLSRLASVSPKAVLAMCDRGLVLELAAILTRPPAAREPPPAAAAPPTADAASPTASASALTARRPRTRRWATDERTSPPAEAECDASSPELVAWLDRSITPSAEEWGVDYALVDGVCQVCQTLLKEPSLKARLLGDGAPTAESSRHAAAARHASRALESDSAAALLCGLHIASAAMSRRARDSAEAKLIAGVRTLEDGARAPSAARPASVHQLPARPTPSPKDAVAASAAQLKAGDKKSRKALADSVRRADALAADLERWSPGLYERALASLSPGLWSSCAQCQLDGARTFGALVAYSNSPAACRVAPGCCLLPRALSLVSGHACAAPRACATVLWATRLSLLKSMDELTARSPEISVCARS